MKILLKNIKNRISLIALLSLATALMLTTVSCDREAIYDNIKDFGGKEKIYPAPFDTIFAQRGYERVEIDLRKGGRIPSSKIALGKAKKTVVVYDEDTAEPVEIRIDSICSYVNIKGLTEPRIYRFKIYTEDQYGDRSIPQEISVMPYTSYDRDVLQQGILDPFSSITSSALIMEWPTGLHSIMMEYHGMEYSYYDADGVLHSGSQDKSPRIHANNLPEGEEVIFNMTYRMLPILDNGSKLLDTISILKPYVVQIPLITQSFIPSELNILRGNGITDFTLAAANSVTELTYPMNMTTFADLFFFNNVHTLNLTGKGLPGTLETLVYSGNGESARVGGGEWQEFMMPVDQPDRIRQATGKAPEGLQTLKDALDSGQITKIRYIPKTMGTNFDAFLQPYVQSGIVELLDYNNNAYFPDSVYLQPQFFGNGTVQGTPWRMDYAYSGDVLPNTSNIVRFNPAAETVNGATVNMNLYQLNQSDGKNIYRCVVRSHNPTFIFALPRQWRYDNQRYRYLKFKMMIGCDKSLVSNSEGTNYVRFREPWIRPVNRLWAYTGNSDYGDGYWDPGTGPFPPLSDNEIDNKTWKEYTVDMSQNDGGDNSNRRNRVYGVNCGHESVGSFNYNASRQIVFYIADFRLCKTIND